MFPANVSECHWVCFVVRMDEKRIILYDPSYIVGSKQYDIPTNILKKMKALGCFLDLFTQNDECMSEISKSYPLEWKFERDETANLPHQRDSYNCGAYVSLYAYGIATKSTLDGSLFTEEIMNSIVRKNIAFIMMKSVISFHLNDSSQYSEMDFEVDPKLTKYFPQTSNDKDDVKVWMNKKILHEDLRQLRKLTQTRITRGSLKNQNNSIIDQCKHEYKDENRSKSSCCVCKDGKCNPKRCFCLLGKRGESQKCKITCSCKGLCK